jgi:hypothetical protein
MASLAQRYFETLATLARGMLFISCDAVVIGVQNGSETRLVPLALPAPAASSEMLVEPSLPRTS